MAIAHVSGTLPEAALVETHYACEAVLACGAAFGAVEAGDSPFAQKADVSARASDGSIALLWLAHWNNTDAADGLLRAGADPNAATISAGNAEAMEGPLPCKS